MRPDMMADTTVPAGRDLLWYVAHTKPRQERVAVENLLATATAFTCPN